MTDRYDKGGIMKPSVKAEKESKIVRFDWAMKNLLRNKANFDILEGFLSELLKEKVIIEHVLDSESNQETRETKFNRVDVLVITEKKEKIIVEVQTASEWDFWHRILFGTSKVITEHLKIGEPYANVKKVISVSILFFDLGGSDYIYKGYNDFIGVHNNELMEFNDKHAELYLDRGCKFPRDIFPTYYIIQLKRFAGIVKDKFDEWVYLLKNEAIKSSFTAQGVVSAKNKLDILKLPENALRSYNKYLAGLSFEASMIQTHQLEMEYAEKRRKAADEKRKAAEEKRKAAEEKRKAAEEKRKAAEEKRKVADEKRKAAEEKLAAVEQKAIMGLLKSGISARDVAKALDMPIAKVIKFSKNDS